jgi:hypothetical protein
MGGYECPRLGEKGVLPEEAVTCTPKINTLTADARRFTQMGGWASITVMSH